MEKFKHLQKIKELYEKDVNIMQYLKENSKNEPNDIEDILISYDFQSGSYIKGFSENPKIKNKYCSGLAKIIDKIDDIESILEVGVGEATTLKTLLRHLKNVPNNIFGFDISWSRLKFAKEFLKDFGINNVNLFTANLFNIPLLDNSIDIIYTSHSIEPNGGKEKEALEELYRVAKKYLILLEPSFEFANAKEKLRMKEHGYITNLYGSAKDLGYNIIEYRPFDFSENENNPTGLMIIEKKTNESNKSNLVCPISHTELINYNENLLYSKESFLAYPVIDNIPCLLKENSVLASHLLTNYQGYKRENNIILNNI